MLAIFAFLLEAAVEKRSPIDAAEEPETPRTIV